MIRVVVADDHPVVRDGLRALFASLPAIELVGEATTGREAVRAAVTARPDVLVMDLRMPDLDGAAATAEIAVVAPDVAVLVLTMFEDDDSVFAAMRAGARGYLVKGAVAGGDLARDHGGGGRRGRLRARASRGGCSTTSRRRRPRRPTRSRS